jgi:hypothetical protein
MIREWMGGDNEEWRGGRERERRNSQLRQERKKRGRKTHPRTADPPQSDVAWCTEEVKDDVELVDVVLTLEDRATSEKLGEDATDGPDVD